VRRPFAFHVMLSTQPGFVRHPAPRFALRAELSDDMELEGVLGRAAGDGGAGS
jgi:hypothetical protein